MTASANERRRVGLSRIWTTSDLGVGADQLTTRRRKRVSHLLTTGSAPSSLMVRGRRKPSTVVSVEEAVCHRAPRGRELARRRADIRSKLPDDVATVPDLSHIRE